MCARLDLQSQKNDSKVRNGIELDIPAYWEMYTALSFSHYFGDIIKSFSNKMGNRQIPPYQEIYSGLLIGYDYISSYWRSNFAYISSYGVLLEYTIYWNAIPYLIRRYWFSFIMGYNVISYWEDDFTAYWESLLYNRAY